MQRYDASGVPDPEGCYVLAADAEAQIHKSASIAAQTREQLLQKDDEIQMLKSVQVRTSKCEKGHVFVYNGEPCPYCLIETICDSAIHS